MINCLRSILVHAKGCLSLMLQCDYSNNCAKTFDEKYDALSQCPTCSVLLLAILSNNSLCGTNLRASVLLCISPPSQKNNRFTLSVLLTQLQVRRALQVARESCSGSPSSFCRVGQSSLQQVRRRRCRCRRRCCPKKTLPHGASRTLAQRAMRNTSTVSP